MRGFNHVVRRWWLGRLEATWVKDDTHRTRLDIDMRIHFPGMWRMGHSRAGRLHWKHNLYHSSSLAWSVLQNKNHHFPPLLRYHYYPVISPMSHGENTPGMVRLNTYTLPVVCVHIWLSILCILFRWLLIWYLVIV